MKHLISQFQGGCAYFAFQRYKSGVDAAFATYESDPAANQYSSYPIGNETDQYSEAPFSGGQPQRGKFHKRNFHLTQSDMQHFSSIQTGGNEYQAPTY